MNIYHLPPQPTEFVGRSDELAVINGLLTEPTCRLLTLVGPGGIGKTRLAIEAAAAQAALYMDGVYFVPLQPLTSPDFMVSAIAASLGFQFAGPLDPQIQLFNYLQDCAFLLLLDNFEHLMSGIGLLADMLTAAPRLKLVVTSREILNLREEWRYPVMGMRLPPDDASGSLQDYDAIRLFERLARRAQADFSLEAEHESVIRICQQVEGMPLGIEMATSWLKRLPCAEILKEIERGLDILENPAYNVEPRHRSMRAMLNQSWDLLSKIEQTVFMNVSVFHGGFQREAAEVVAGASLATLSALVDKSLLRVDNTGRYDLHELVRQYGDEQLNHSRPEANRIQALHSAYFADFMEEHWELLNSMQLKPALQAIETEIDNFRSAWRWAVEHKNADIIQKSIASFEFFYDVRCWFDEGARALEAALGALETDVADEFAYAQALRCYGYFSMHLMHFDLAKVLLDESLTIFRRLDVQKEIAHTLGTSASIPMLTGGPVVEADRVFEESLMLYKAIDDRQGMAWVLRWRANNWLWRDNNYEKARVFASESAALSREMNELGRVDQAFAVLAWCSYFAGEFGEAKRLHQECFTIAYEFGFAWLIMESNVGLGLSELALGEYAQAVPHCHEGVSRIMQLGHWTMLFIRMVFAEIAPVLCQYGETIKAVEYLALALYVPLWDLHPLNRSRGEHLLSTLQAQIVPGEFAAAMQRGRMLTLESAAESLIADLWAIQNTPPTALTEPAILNKRELEILRLIAEGLTNPEIGERLFIAPSTVKWHCEEIYGKLDVHKRTQAVARARELGLIP